MENTKELLLSPQNKRYVIYPVEYNDIWDKYKQLKESFLSSKDLRGLELLPEFIDAGVDCI